MAGFVEAPLPGAVPGFPCLVSPRTNTTITAVSGGDEARNQNWAHPLRKFQLPKADARKWTEVLQPLRDHWLCVVGPTLSWPFRDPFDFASIPLLAPNEGNGDDTAILARISSTDQVLGTGDGTTRTFQLGKAYASGAASYSRAIGLPILSSLKVSDNGSLKTQGTDYTVTRPGGVVTFASAPAAGHALKWGGLFDVPVRYEADDSFDAVIAAVGVGGFAQLNLSETRLC